MMLHKLRRLHSAASPQDLLKPAKQLRAIMPRVKRGFASGTLGRSAKYFASLRSGRRLLAQYICRPLRGLLSFSTTLPRVSLAKPRSTLGFMLAPAPRVAIFFNHSTWGFARKASLHPRLYACTRSAGCYLFHHFT